MEHQGKAQMVPGIQEPYEEPQASELIIDSDRTTVEEAGEIVLRELKSIGWI